MARRQRILGIAAVLVLSVAGCAHAVSGDAGPATVVASTASLASSAPPIRALSSPVRSAPIPTTPVSQVPRSTAAVSSAAPTPVVEWMLPAPKDVPRRNNQFGNKLADVGQTYEIIYSDNQQTVLRFVVDSIEVDAKCDQPDKPANGHFLIISLRVQLGEATAAQVRDADIGFTADKWLAFDSRNVAQVGISAHGGTCLATSAFPYASDLKSGVVVSGRVALDVSATKGTALLLNDISGGWIYNFG